MTTIAHAHNPALKDPYTRYRRTLLSNEEVREYSQLRPGIAVRDVLLLWVQIFAAWTACAIWTEWWVVLLAVPVIGTRVYALHVIAHDGLHRRLFDSQQKNDLFCDLFILGAEGAVTHLNNQNHNLHHRMLANDSDPDRHKYTSSNKTTRLQLLLCLTGLSGLVPLWRNVFKREKVKAPSLKKQTYTTRDVAILVGWQVALIGGLSLAIGWWAYPVLWMVPVYVFAYCGDQIRFFLEHAHPEHDDTADEKRLITYTGNWLERTLFAPMNMNFHAVHHLWPSIPYYNLKKVDLLIRDRDGTDGMLWRKSYFGMLFTYYKALPLPGCRRELHPEGRVEVTA